MSDRTKCVDQLKDYSKTKTVREVGWLIVSLLSTESVWPSDQNDNQHIEMHAHQK